MKFKKGDEVQILVTTIPESNGIKVRDYFPEGWGYYTQTWEHNKSLIKSPIHTHQVYWFHNRQLKKRSGEQLKLF